MFWLFRRTLVTLMLLGWSSLAWAHQIELMSYNVENLFDTEHDEGKDDFQFLPRASQAFKAYCKNPPQGDRYAEKNCSRPVDWTTDKLALKISQIKKVFDLRQKESAARAYPDIVGLTEVENEKVVGQLARELGYRKFVVTNSRDQRGIDVAVMWRDSAVLKYVSHAAYDIPDLSKASRPILEVKFDLNGKSLLVYVNHWPSQRNPATDRIKAAQKLLQIIEQRQREDASVSYVIMGDFNTLPSDFPHPYHQALFTAEKSDLVDVHTVYKRAAKKKKVPRKDLALGTYFYPPQMAWNLLDRFFVPRRMIEGTSPIHVSLASYEIYAPRLISNPFKYTRRGVLKGSVVMGVPAKYRHRASDASKVGYSDHFPIYITLDF